MTSKARCTDKLRQHLVDVLKAEPNEYPGESTAGSRGKLPSIAQSASRRIKGRSFWASGQGFFETLSHPGTVGIMESAEGCGDGTDCLRNVTGRCSVSNSLI